MSLSFMPAALGGYTPRHAAPSASLAPTTRSALAVGLAVAVLPLAAAPAGAATTAKAATTVGFSAPASDADGRVPVKVRLTADGRAVKDGFVRLERKTSSGWTYAGRLLTRADGTGSGTLNVPRTSTLRATYGGTSVRTAAVSTARTVTIGATSNRSAAVLRAAARQVGKPYVYGATGPNAFDCSGFTRYVYAQVGKTLPRTSTQQESATTRVSKASARPGDLVFIKGVRGHVGIYAGNGNMYDAPRTGKNVSLRKIWTANYVIGRVK